MVLTPAERRGALIVVVLLLIGAGWDAWRAHTPRLSRLPEAPAPVNAPAPASRADSIPAPGAPPAVRGRIDLNRATAQELDALPGIGPVLADRIVQHRVQHGPFRSVDDLAAVRGIGPRALERLRPRVGVGKP